MRDRNGLDQKDAGLVAAARAWLGPPPPPLMALLVAVPNLVMALTLRLSGRAAGAVRPSTLIGGRGGKARLEPAAAMSGRARCRQSGFSLLEVLIALVIAGMSMGIVFRAGAESVQATAVAARYQDAVSHARSRLDAAGAAPMAGEQSGEDGGGFRWRTQVRAVGSTGKSDAAGRPDTSAGTLTVTLYAVTVWITWREGSRNRLVRLDTQRLLAAAPG
jgi:general secretion pathway protein I